MSTTMVMHRTESTGIASSRVTLRSDDDWHALPSSPDVAYTALCEEPNCLCAGTDHTIDWGGAPNHKAFSWSSDFGCLVEVVKYMVTSDESSSLWRVEGFLTDDDMPLTSERVHAFTVHYNSAAALAAELNEGAA